MSLSAEAGSQNCDGRSADVEADLPLLLARLRWRLEASRRTALRAVEECVRRVAALRRQAADPSLDALLHGFDAVRAELDALDPQPSIALEEIEPLAKRLIALQAELSRHAAALGKHAGHGAAQSGPAPGRS